MQNIWAARAQNGDKSIYFRYGLKHKEWTEPAGSKGPLALNNKSNRGLSLGRKIPLRARLTVAAVDPEEGQVSKPGLDRLKGSMTRN